MRKPAFASAHSHAFQRALRGQAQRPATSGTNTFWTWRESMYRLALSLTPETIESTARVAFRELRQAGVLTVGEFHYLHHQADGTPYSDRTLLSQRVIAAALEEGLRIALFRVAYHRAGHGRSLEPAQRRFVDSDVDSVLRDVDDLRARYKDDARVRIGVAPHSVRAVPPGWLAPLGRYASEHALPFHMHVAEQERENAECLAETGRSPVELLSEHGVLTPRFVAVHATHLSETETKLLGAAKSYACICPTTERDLGDGLPNLSALRAAGVRLVVGIDSHVVTDPFEEMRSLETLERLRTQSRVTFRGKPTPAENLWNSASVLGAQACGFADAGGDVLLDRSAEALLLVEEEFLSDAIVFSGSPRLVAGLEPYKER